MTIEDLRKEYEDTAQTKWWTNPVCHGETGFASWEYQTWLEARVLSQDAELANLKEGMASDVEVMGEFVLEIDNLTAELTKLREGEEVKLRRAALFAWKRQGRMDRGIIPVQAFEEMFADFLTSLKNEEVTDKNLIWIKCGGCDGAGTVGDNICPRCGGAGGDLP